MLCNVGHNHNASDCVSLSDFRLKRHCSYGCNPRATDLPLSVLPALTLFFFFPTLPNLCLPHKIYSWAHLKSCAVFIFSSVCHPHPLTSVQNVEMWDVFWWSLWPSVLSLPASLQRATDELKLRVETAGSIASACLFRTDGLQCVTVWFVCFLH